MKQNEEQAQTLIYLMDLVVDSYMAGYVQACKDADREDLLLKVAEESFAENAYKALFGEEMPSCETK